MSQLPPARCIQNQASKAERKWSVTAGKINSGAVRRESDILEKQRARAAKELSEEGTARKKKKKAPPRIRTRHSPEKGVGTARRESR